MNSQPRYRYHLHAQQQDPTRTKSIRRTYGQRLRAAFGRINAAIREAVIEDDIFDLEDGELGEDEVQRLADTFANAELRAVDEPPDLSNIDPDQRIERFQDWLDEAMESEVLEVIERDENVYVRRAYEHGLRDADRNLRQAGMDVEPTDLEDARQFVQAPVHERKLQLLFSRNYAELDGITNAVSQQVTRELANAIAAGENPRETARRITDRIDKIGKTRATVLARTETIKAHSDATIERYRQQGVDRVGIEPEVQIQTAGDQQVCQQCRSVARRAPWSLDEFEGSTNQPPIHPQCRCAVLPVISESAAQAFVEHPHEFVAMYRAGAFARDEHYYEVLASADAAEATELTAQAVAA